LRGPISKREHKALAPPRPAAMVRSAKVYWRNWFLLSLLLLSAGGAVATAFWFYEAPWSLPILQPQTVAPARETDRHAWRTDTLQQKEEHRSPRLAFQDLRAAVNQPHALGIVLINGTGGETLVLSGFVEGTGLSAGTALGTTRWSVPGRDLDQTFISAPENFDGIMQVTVTLYSSRQDILETKEVRFEWNISHKGDKLPVQISPAQPLAR
jgi:PAS domain-containing protein